VAFLVGCQNPFGLGGQELDDDIAANDTHDPETDSGGEDTSVIVGGGTDFGIAYHQVSCEDTLPDPGLSVTSDAPGTVHALELGFEGACTSQWTIAAHSDAAGQIDVSYTTPEDTGVSSGCVCNWTFDYTILGVPSGETTVTSPGGSGATTVE